METGIVYRGDVAFKNGQHHHCLFVDGVQMLPIGGMVSWGNLTGSAYNTALTILTHALGDRKKAKGLSHRFKREVLSEFYFDVSWQMRREDIFRWLDGKKDIASWQPCVHFA